MSSFLSVKISRAEACENSQALLTEEPTLPYAHESSVRFSSAPAHDLIYEQQAQLLRDSRCESLPDMRKSMKIFREYSQGNVSV